jgi:hypothetical protein
VNRSYMPARVSPILPCGRPYGSEALASGWLLSGSDEPAVSGVLVTGEDGTWVTAWPDTAGRYLPADPRENAA